MQYSSTSRKQGHRGCCPFPLHPKSPPNLPPLRSGPSPLTIPNTSSTITMPASLRSDCCSPSLRNAVRLPSGINVHLHRNTQVEGITDFFPGKRPKVRIARHLVEDERMANRLRTTLTHELGQLKFHAFM